MPVWYGRGRDYALMAPKQYFVRTQMPYGQWTCADGREVLFDRNYKPIAFRYPGQQPERADCSEWVQWKKQEWFYDDGTPMARKRRVAEQKLHEWGIFETVMTEIVELVAASKHRARE